MLNINFLQNNKIKKNRFVDGYNLFDEYKLCSQCKRNDDLNEWNNNIVFVLKWDGDVPYKFRKEYKLTTFGKF